MSAPAIVRPPTRGQAVAQALLALPRHGRLVFRADRAEANALRESGERWLKTTHPEVRLQVYRTHPGSRQTYTLTEWEARIVPRERTTA